MNRCAPRLAGVAASLTALLLLAPSPARAQTTAPQTPPAQTTAPQTGAPPQPFAPDWAMIAGWDVFVNKGCGKCHSVRGVGGKVGPDLGRIQDGKSFFDIGADMWNHLPKMGAKMREAGIARPTLTATEAANVIAFIFTAQYQDESGDPKVGEKLFTMKGCVQCHSVGGVGGHVGPALDPMKRANSPVLVAAAMWNHASRMADVMKQKGIARPTFEGKELLDVISYIASASKDTSTETIQVAPGTPERGKKLFADKHCASCHAVGGVGPRVGPDLGRPGHHISITAFAERMWNHAPAMMAKMKERGVQVPTLAGQETADILAYLYVSRYFDQATNATRGAQLLTAKGCLNCHSVRGKGGTVSADFATSTVARTPAALVAGMWNHSGLMEAQAEKRQVAWPTLTGQELGDISAYLTSLAGGGGKKGAK